MATLSKEMLAALQTADKKSSYIKREWVTDEKLVFSLKEYAELVNPIYKYVCGNPTIIAKTKKNNDVFLKMSIPLKGGTTVEFELSYEEEFDEGDVIDVNTLKFCVETWLDSKHLYATGDVI